MNNACFIVHDKNGQVLGYFYYEQESPAGARPPIGPRTRRGPLTEVSNLHSAPPPAFFMIWFGSIVYSNFEMLSMIERQRLLWWASGNAVAVTPLAARPVKLRLPTLKVRSHERVVNIDVTVRETMDSAVNEMLYRRVSRNSYCRRRDAENPL